jgi:hypothetical protein
MRSSLSRRIFPTPAGKGALAEINGFAALGTIMRVVELIGKNFDFLAAFRATADKRVQRPEPFKTGAML